MQTQLRYSVNTMQWATAFFNPDSTEQTTDTVRIVHITSASFSCLEFSSGCPFGSGLTQVSECLTSKTLNLFHTLHNIVYSFGIYRIF